MKQNEAVQNMEVSSDLLKVTKPVSSCKGGLRTMPFIIANETFEKVASVGMQANMILYLKREYHLDTATGTSILFLWGAISNFMPILGAFLADSYLGRFRVIAWATVITLMGMIGLWFTAIFPAVRPLHCPQYNAGCAKPSDAQLALLFSSFALMSIGAGGIRPCSLAFGADQLDNPNNPKNEMILQSFFNFYYATVGISFMLSLTFIVYIQNKFGWIVGFGVPVGLMLLSNILFLVGSKLYIKVKAHKSLMTSFAQVAVAAFKNKHLSLPTIDSDGKYFHTKGSKLVYPTAKLRFLNKASIITNPDQDLNADGSAAEPWKLCTVQQVEELKALIRVLPIWSSGIMIAVTINQHSFPVLQAITMNRHLAGKFKIPPGSFGVFSLLTLTIWVAIYDRLIVPWLSKYTKRPRGLSLRQRMGVGLVISCIATSVAALVEAARRRRAIHEGLSNSPYSVVNMSAIWLVPQYCLTGLGEAFNAIGQIEFYYSQFHKSMTSIGVALFSLGMAIGNVLGSLIVTIVDRLSKTKGNQSWVSGNLNKGHYDYYYWILTIMSVGNVFYFLLCGWAYGSEEQKIWDDGEGSNVKLEEDIGKSKESPMVDVIKAKGSPIVFSA